MILSDRKVVFSLTTIPSRINTLLPTLKSLHKQTCKVDNIYLTIPEKCKRLNEKYPEIPNKIKHLCDIVYVKEDYGSLTKLMGGLIRENNPETIIITVDDDVIYPETLVEDLLYWHKKYPNSALSSSGLSVGHYPFKYSVKFNQKSNDYWFTMKNCNGKKVDILYGYSGAVYKRGFFPTKYKLYDKFLKWALNDNDLFHNDDVYISFYLNKENIDRRLVEIDDVYNKSGNDGLSNNTIKFFYSLDKAVTKCEKMKWFKSRASINATETFGFIALLVILLILLLFIFLINYLL